MRRNIADTLRYFRENLLGLFTDCVIVFLILLAADAVACFLDKDIPDRTLRFFTGQLGGITLDATDAKGLSEALLTTNLVAASESFVLGLIPFARLSVFPLAENAFILSSFGVLYCNEGYGLGAYLAGILPHGIFELSALLLSCAMGLKLCATVTGRLLHLSADSVVGTFLLCTRVFCVIVFPLLYLAALIEAYLTPQILSLFL